MNSILFDQFVNVKAGEAYRLFPFGKIVKNGKVRDITPEYAATIKLPHFKPAIKLGSHEDVTPAGGHIVALEVRADGLYAVPELNEKGAQAIADGAYKYHSPEIIWEGGLEDPTSGDVISAPLILGDALLHTPHLGEAAAMYSIETVKVGNFEMTPESQSIIDACKACMQACTNCLVACSTCPNADDANHRSCISSCEQCISVCAECIRRCMAGDMSACQMCMDCCSMCVKCCEDCGESCADCKAACDTCMAACKACAAACSMGATNMSAEPNKEKKMDETFKVPASFKGLWDKFVASLAKAEPEKVEVIPDEYKAAVVERDELKARIAEQAKATERKALVEKFDAELKETKADPTLAELLADVPAETAEAVMKQFKALSAQIDESKLTGEQGTEGQPVDDPKAAFNAAVLSLSNDKKISYNAAFEEVKTSQPDLFKAWAKK